MVPTDLYIQENDEEMMLLARSLSIYLWPLLSPSPLLSLLFDRRFFPLQTYIALYATHTHTHERAEEQSGLTILNGVVMMVAVVVVAVLIDRTVVFYLT